ncbi:hypothetical protein BZK37_17395 [Enterococcus casseliflavus]|nr:hypothetical protein BZK37_17395 [Enterococcus casseliflavus]
MREKRLSPRITKNTKKKIAIAVALGGVLFSGGLGIHLLHSPEKNESKEIEYTTISLDVKGSTTYGGAVFHL